MNEQERLKQALSGVGASKTIYSMVMPETEEAKRAVLRGDARKAIEHAFETGHSLTDTDSIMKALDRADGSYFGQFREAWTQKQDTLHHEFFDRWFDWSKPIANVSRDAFTYHYPTAGAGEGLRAMIDEYGARARRDMFAPEIHVFNGEYEGYSGFAKAAYIPMVQHDRKNWRETIDALAEASKTKPIQIYLSQPSAIDGNVWQDYDAFMQTLAEKAPNVEVILDLTYVGCIAKETHIRTDYPNIPAIAFSLSKPCGAYYDRIGGVIAKPRDGQDPYPALFGNIWFKNLTSLSIGNEFMKRHGVYDMPRKYAPIQQEAMEEISANLKKQGHAVDLKPSDVFVLATAEMPEHPSDIHKYLERPAEGRSILRVCLTPTMSEKIGMAKTHEVTPRYYENVTSQDKTQQGRQ